MDIDTLFFFDDKPRELALYDELMAWVRESCEFWNR